MRNPTIAWYFKGAGSQKTNLDVSTKELNVNLKSASDVGEYSCEFHKTEKPETIKKMVIPVMIDVSGNGCRGSSVSTSNSSSSSGSGSSFGSISGNFSSNNFDQQIAHFNRQVAEMMNRMERERADFESGSLFIETVFHASFQVSYTRRQNTGDCLHIKYEDLS